MKKAFYLEDWLVEPALDRIRKNGSIIKLRPQVMDLLVYIANHPREIITADDILAAVWPGKVTTHASVYNCLKELRHALNDDPHEPRYIETIPKRGYRLIVPVRQTEAYEDRDRRVFSKFTGRQFTVSAMAILLAVVILAERMGNQGETEDITEPVVPEKSIAVLPFSDMSPAGDQGYFADGVAEEILNELAQSPELRVTARSSSFLFRDSDEDLKTIGAKLGVAYLLEGSIRKDAGRVRITTQLIDTRNGFHLWSQEYDHELGEILGIQESIGSEVANALQVTLLDDESLHGVALTGEELDTRVYDQFLRAKNLINQKRKEPLREAIRLLHEVIETNPDFMWARVLLADALLTLPWEYRELYASGSEPEPLVGDPEFPIRWFNLLSRLADSMRDVIAMEPALADAYLVLGKLLRNQKQPEQAESALLKAIKLNPSLAEAHRHLGLNYMKLPVSFNKTIECFRRAVEVDPYSIESRMSLAHSLTAVPETRQEMWAVFRGAQMVLPWTPRMGLTEARLLVSEGRYADAIRVLEDTLGREDYPQAESLLTEFLYLLGETGRAREISPGHELWRTDPGNSNLPDWERCPGHPENDRHDIQNWRAFVCMWRHKWTEVIVCLDHLSGPEELARDPTNRAITPSSMPIALALAHKMKGNPVLAEQYASIEQDALGVRTENGKLRGWFHARFNARLAALRGANDLALDELSAMLDFGHLDPWVFEHPVYDEIRNLPRFRQLQNRRIELVNAQRAQLGLDPLPLMPALPDA